MTRILLILISLFFATSVHAQETFTLEQSVEFALENNIDIRKAALDKDQADHKSKEVRSSGLPQINASSELQFFPNLPTQLLPGEIIGQPGTQIPVQFGTDYTLNAGLEASQLLYSQSFITGLKAARSSEELYNLLEIQTEEDVIYQVSSAFYSTLQLQSQMKVLEANLDQINQLEEIISAQVEQELVTKTELNRIRVNKTNLNTQLQSLKTGAEQQKNYLKVLMGMPVDRPLNLKESEDLKEVDSSALLYDKQKPIEIKLLEKKKELNLLNKKNILSGYYPSLAAFGQQSWQAQRNEFNFLDSSQPWFQQTVIGVQLQVPIFDGMMKRHQTEQAKIEIEKLELDKLNTERSLNMQYQNAREQLLNSLASVEAQQANRELAREVYEETQLLYRQQVASLTDVLDAETAYRQAQTNFITEVLKFRQSELDLLKSQGQLKEIINY